MSLLNYSLRNIRRNKKRSSIIVLSVSVSVFVILLILSFVNALLKNIVDNSVSHSTGHIRIRTLKYAQNEYTNPIKYYIKDEERIIESLKNMQEVSYVEPLIITDASIYIDGKLKNVEVVAFDFENSYFLKTGKLSSNNKIIPSEDDVFVTKSLQEKYNLNIDEKLTVIFRTANSSTNAKTFRIRDFIYFNDSSCNTPRLYCSIFALEKILHIDGSTLLLVHLNSAKEKTNVASKIKNIINFDDYEIKTIDEISFVSRSLSLYHGVCFIIEILFYFIVSLLIFNTITININERKKEVGILISLGFSRKRIRLIFTTEQLFLSLIGCIFSLIFSFMLVMYFNKNGIDMSVFGTNSATSWNFPKIFYPFLTFTDILKAILLSLFISFISCCIATLKIKKDSVVYHLREEL